MMSFSPFCFSSKKLLALLSAGVCCTGFFSSAKGDPAPAAETKHSDAVAEAEIDKRFNANPNTRGLRNIIYAYIPEFLSQCPTWDSEMQDWHKCENAVPVAAIVNFRDKLRKEPLNTRIQQWFFLDAIGGIERPNDDMVRAKSFLSKYFAKIVLHELHDDNGWCYGPSWVGHSQKAWMPCAEIPPFNSRTLPQWALYTPPKKHPRPTWPGTFDDTAPEETGPMEVPEKVIAQAAKPAPQAGNLTKSYKSDDDNLASLPALPAQNTPVDPDILLKRAAEISQSPEGAALFARIINGNPAERQKALKEAAETLHMPQGDILATAKALKSTPQGMLILQQIQQLADATPAERQQSLEQVAGLLGVKPEAAQEALRNLSEASQNHPQTTQQLLDQAKHIVSNPQLMEQAKNALGSSQSNPEQAQRAERPASGEDNDRQPSPESLNQADRGVFEIDQHNPNRKEANAGGDRDLLSYSHPDDAPGSSEDNYGNSEDRNSRGSQYHSYGEGNSGAGDESGNFQNPNSPANNPAEDGVSAASRGPMPDMSDMSNMPQNRPTPSAEPASPAQNPSSSNPSPFSSAYNQPNTYGAEHSAASSWQEEAFGGGSGNSGAHPYTDPNFAAHQAAPPQGENSPPAPENLGKIGDSTGGQTYVNGKPVSPDAYHKQIPASAPAASAPKPASAASSPPASGTAAQKRKIVSADTLENAALNNQNSALNNANNANNANANGEDGEWKILKR